MSDLVYSDPVTAFEPWKNYPDLTRDRLSTIAGIIRDVRRETVVLHDPEHGDGPWSLGCRAYERICFAIRKAANDSDWLTILQQTRNLEFGFAIGTIPFRFYRGKPDEPPDNYLFKTFGELQHLQLCLEIEGLRPIDNILRLAVETDATREVSAVTLVELDDAGNALSVYPVPFGGNLQNITSIQTPAVDLPPVVAEPLKKEEEQEQKKKNALGSVS